jgi:hypothetical protein
MTNELIDELGSIYSRDDFDNPSPFEMTFAEFLEKVVAPGKTEIDILFDAYQLERLVTYYNHQVKEQWKFTFDQFLSKVRSGAWEQRFTA